MSILKKPYEISVYDDVLIDGVFQEKRLGLIGSDKMQYQGRAFEPNLVRNVNGQNKLTFKMYKKYIDPITGKKVYNPFIDWLISERKVKLHYENKWYDFIIKDINENSANYLYSYSLEDAQVQELSKNGFGVTLDAALMNNMGNATYLGNQALSETDWIVGGDVIVQTVEDNLVYVTIPGGTSVRHILDQREVEGAYPNGITEESYTFVNDTTVLAFYSSCKNKPHRFQFIYANNGEYGKTSTGEYKISRNDKRIITEKDCQYYIDFTNPKADYSVEIQTYGLFLPAGFKIATPPVKEGDGNDKDTVISSWYRGNRYGFAQQAEYIPLLERYCQKFFKEENVTLDSNNLVLLKEASYQGNISGNFDFEQEKPSFSGTKNSKYSGIYFKMRYEDIDTYVVSYELEVTEGVLKNIGGHAKSFEISSYQVTNNGDEVEGALDKNNCIYSFTSNQPIGVHLQITAKYKKKSNVEDSSPYIFIQPNRGLEDAIGFKLTNINLHITGDYYGYTDSDYVSPTLIQNYINNYKFESKTGWTATSSTEYSSTEKPEVINAFGRFNNNIFTAITDDFINGEYNEDNTYTPYMKMTIKQNNQFVLNSGIQDNRSLIKNITKGEEWVLDYDIVDNVGNQVLSGINFEISEYIYSSSTGIYHEREDNIGFLERAIVLNEQPKSGCRKIFKVDYSFYDEEDFKKNCKICLKIQPTNIGTYYIKNIALYKKSLDNSSKIIVPDYDSKNSEAVSEWIKQGVLEEKYSYFNSWYVNADNPNQCTDKEKLPLVTTTILDYATYKPIYNTGAQKVRSVTIKESNYFNILQTIAETFEQWLVIQVERNDDGSILPYGKKILFKNYRGDNNYACFRYGVNLKDIQRNYSSKNIVTKLVVKQNSNQLAKDGFCTIQRAGANPTGENYIYDFQYYHGTGVMGADEFFSTNYELDGATGPDLNNGTEYNLNGYFPRIKTLNDKLLPINQEIIGLQADLVKKKADLEVANSTYEAANSGIETVREDFSALTGVYPEEASYDQIENISNARIELKEDWYNVTAQIKTNSNTVEATITAQKSDKQVQPRLKFSQDAEVVGAASAGSYSLKKSSKWGGIYLEWDYIKNQTYRLEYDLIVQNSDAEKISTLGGHATPFNNYTITVKDSSGQNIPSSSWSNGILTLNSKLGTGTYKVIVQGKFIKPDDHTPYFWIQPNRGNENEATCIISNIKLWHVGGTPAEVGFERTAKFTVAIDITLDTTPSKIITRSYNLTCIVPADLTVAKCAQVIAPLDWSRSDIQSYITEYTTHYEKIESSLANKNDLEPKIAKIEQEIQTKNSERQTLLQYKTKLNQLFFKRYARFIQEGTWINEEYVDDEKYYADAQSVLYNSCYPQVVYAINVLELSQLPGYELFKFELGDKTWAIDDEFFGEGIREEVVITELSEMLDNPSQNSIKVQNFKNQFQGLFQKITATVQQTQYNVGSYEKGAALVDASIEKKNEFITKAINEASTFLSPGKSHEVVWDNSGITVTEQGVPTNQVRIVGGAILLSAEDPKTRKQTWITGVTNKGISANLITAGRLDAGAVQIMSGDDPVFRWDAYGISAFDAFWIDDSSVSNITGINTKKFVRFDKHGIYGINSESNNQNIDGSNWHPTGNNPLKEIDKMATFSLTWDGLKVTNSNNITLRIGDAAKSNNGTSLLEVRDSGNNTTFAITENGSLIWGAGSTAQRALYAKTQLDAPVGTWDSFDDSNEEGENKWHKLKAPEDYFVSYSADGGNTWSDPIQIQGYNGSQGPQGPQGLDGETVYYIYHDKADSIPSVPTELDYTKIPNIKSENYNGWYKIQTEDSVYSSHKIATSATQSDIEWGPATRMSGVATTYNDLWAALDEKSTQENTYGGIYTIEDGDDKYIGINADLIQTGALCVGNRPTITNGIVSNWNNNILYASFTTLDGQQLPIVGLAGWEVNSTSIYKSYTVSNKQRESWLSSTNEYMLALGTTTTGDGSTAPFSVKKDGTLYAAKGNVGGWILSETALYKPHAATIDGVKTKVYTGFKIPSNTNHLEDKVLFMGATDHRGSNAPFYVRADGAIYSTSGQFGGWTLTPTGIKGGYTSGGTTRYVGLNKPSNVTNNTVAFYAGATASAEGGAFQVTYDGSITATKGQISNFRIDNIGLEGDNIGFYNGTGYLDDPDIRFWVGLKLETIEVYDTLTEWGYMASETVEFDFGWYEGKIIEAIAICTSHSNKVTTDCNYNTSSGKTNIKVYVSRKYGDNDQEYTVQLQSYTLKLPALLIRKNGDFVANTVSIRDTFKVFGGAVFGGPVRFAAQVDFDMTPTLISNCIKEIQEIREEIQEIREEILALKS